MNRQLLTKQKIKTSQNTILITGGGSGIGFETAKLFSQNGNTVIITGRNEAKLKSAVQQLQNAHYIVADVTVEADLDRLVERINNEFPELNMLMNNAGLAVLHKVSDSPKAAAIAVDEMTTNFFAPVNLTTRLLPMLKKAKRKEVIVRWARRGFFEWQKSLAFPDKSYRPLTDSQIGFKYEHF